MYSKVVNLNHAHVEVHSIQHYVIKFFHGFAEGSWFSSATLVSSTNKTGRDDITEIMLKVALKTINIYKIARL